jgi:hypothetical protein
MFMILSAQKKHLTTLWWEMYFNVSLVLSHPQCFVRGSLVILFVSITLATSQSFRKLLRKVKRKDKGFLENGELF